MIWDIYKELSPYATMALGSYVGYKYIGIPVNLKKLYKKITNGDK